MPKQPPSAIAVQVRAFLCAVCKAATSAVPMRVLQNERIVLYTLVEERLASPMRA